MNANTDHKLDESRNGALQGLLMTLIGHHFTT